jgi:6-pyruvoyltetrahydropterin/6-carboxytetrahydropterin synthase
MYELMVEESFAAAHQLIGYEGPCENLHGHTWKVQIILSGSKLNELGMLMDFKEIKANLSFIISKLDHKNLNVLPNFKQVNPTSENVAEYIYGELSKKLGKKASLEKVTVFESPTTSATYIRKA